MTKHRTLAEAYAANAADCAQHGHSWIAEYPDGPRTHCSWCGARRTPAEAESEHESKPLARHAGPYVRDVIEWVLSEQGRTL